MIILDRRTQHYISRRNGKSVCFIKDTPPDIVKELKETNANYRKYHPLHHDFVQLIDAHDPYLQEDGPDPDTLPEGDY